MPRTIQIRDLDDDVYAALVRRASEVALAEALDATLLTRDRRLAATRGPTCPIETVGPA